MKFLKKIYPSESDYTRELLYADLANSLTQGDGAKPTYKETLFGANFWRATWICAFLAMTNAFSGGNVIIIYDDLIFQEIKQQVANQCSRSLLSLLSLPSHA